MYSLVSETFALVSARTQTFYDESYSSPTLFERAHAAIYDRDDPHTTLAAPDAYGRQMLVDQYLQFGIERPDFAADAGNATGSARARINRSPRMSGIIAWRFSLD